MNTRVQAKIVGRVQGVGFRPTVYRYATELGLAGFVRNDPAGVTVEVEGTEEAVEKFFAHLTHEPPRQAVITSVEKHPLAPHGEKQFVVVESQSGGAAEVHISPDLATCDDCLRELNDPSDRRHGYPFINCTNCGPRFTILRELPYDRANTSMAGFKMCPACDYEYHEPSDRRFHAQPDACEKCGPQLSLPVGETVELLKAGQIVAIKSLGGFHLACTLPAVGKLRERKHRPHKPFAVMFRDVETIKRHCSVSEAEEAELLSPARPIVILKVEQASRLFAGFPNRRDACSTDSPTIGAFLPYTPIHHLLMQHFEALVMTSGNLAEEPISSEEAELPAVADAVLSHDREIVHKCDDSVLRIVNGQRQFFRRARGFVPNAIRFADHSAHILAVGGELKNTFCLARDGWAFLSQHIGDLKEYRTTEYFEHEISEWQRLMRVSPVAIAHDLHPGYRSTRWAERQGAKLIAVQHHHAHIVSVMAEHELDGEVIGVALDGTGYGTDGTIWGGEFLVATRAGFERIAHFKPYRLPGGEKAIEEPWRMAASVALLENLPANSFETIISKELHTLEGMVATGFQAPLTSSAGRLFDAVAAMLGLCDVATYEAQAAIRLEAAADKSVTGHYPFELTKNNSMSFRACEESPKFSRGEVRDSSQARNDNVRILDFGRAIRGVLADRENVGLAAARFQNTVVAGIVRVCEWVREERGLKRVALSGGAFQNEWILTRTMNELRARRFEVFTNTLVPPNDGGLALGQAAVAGATLEQEARVRAGARD
jgi:hydrogenase maturation protein HypF